MTRVCHVSCSSAITHSMPPNTRSTWVEAPLHHFNRNSVPPRHIWSTHVHQFLVTSSALDHKQSWQRTNTTNNLPARQPPKTTASSIPRSENGPATRQSHNMASMIVRRNQSHWDTQTDITWRTVASSTHLWCLQMLEHDNTSPSPINPSNNARRQQLTLERSSALHAAHIQRPRHTPRLLRGIHSFDIYLATSGTHICEAALINQKLPLVPRHHNTDKMTPPGWYTAPLLFHSMAEETEWAISPVPVKKWTWFSQMEQGSHRHPEWECNCSTSHLSKWSLYNNCQKHSCLVEFSTHVI